MTLGKQRTGSQILIRFIRAYTLPEIHIPSKSSTGHNVSAPNTGSRPQTK